MKKLCVYAILLMGLLGGVTFAQMPEDMQNNTTPEGYYREHLALPAEIRQMLDENKAKEAVAEYEKFKKTAKADALDILLLDARVYGSAAFIDSNANYEKLRDEALKKMVSGYPDDADVILYTALGEDNLEKALEMLSKAIKADPEYLPLYEMRCRIYMAQGKKDAACQDYAKLPEAVRMGLLPPGVSCNKELEAAEK